MKATLTFNLPDEQEEFNTAVHASDALYVIGQIDERMRQIVKYEEHTDAVYDIVSKLRTELLELCHSNKINLH
jgi:hypothetical protein